MGGMKFTVWDYLIIIFVWIPCAPFTWTYHSIASIPYKLHRRQVRKLQDYPPNPRKIKKYLVSGSKKVQRTYSQRKSPFFALPAEIRAMVYQEYVGREDIVITDWEGMKKNYRSPGGYSRSLARALEEGDVDWAFPAVGRRGCRVHQRLHCPCGPPGKVDALSLLVTCRRMYTDFYPYIYTTPTFTFHSPTTLLLFTCTLPPPTLSLIRSLTLNLLPTSLQTPLESLTNGTPSHKATLNSPISFTLFHAPSLTILTNIFPSRPSRFAGSDAAKRQNWPPDIWSVIIRALIQLQGLRRLEIRVKENHFATSKQRPQTQNHALILTPLSALADLPSLSHLTVEIAKDTLHWVKWPNTYMIPKKLYSTVLREGGVREWREVERNNEVIDTRTRI